MVQPDGLGCAHYLESIRILQKYYVRVMDNDCDCALKMADSLSIVSGVLRQGGRKSCEDLILKKLEEDQIFLAVFDGHGGKEAAQYAFENLWENIKSSEGFDSDEPKKVIQAIKAGFVKTHEDMWKVSSKPLFLLYTRLVGD